MNLEARAVSEWLTEIKLSSGGLTEYPPAIRAIENEPEVAKRIVTLGSALADLSPDALAEFSTAARSDSLQSNLRAVMAQVGAARAARILHWMAESDLPEHQKVNAAIIKDDGEEGRALRSIVMAILQRATLNRMFGPDRIIALQAVCVRDEKAA